jgi:hypothetical protein
LKYRAIEEEKEDSQMTNSIGEIGGEFLLGLQTEGKTPDPKEQPDQETRQLSQGNKEL